MGKTLTGTFWQGSLRVTNFIGILLALECSENIPIMISWNALSLQGLFLWKVLLVDIRAWRYSIRQMHYGNTLYALFRSALFSVGSLF